MRSKSCQIVVRRYPYEEPYHLQIVVSARNEDFSARTDFYCNTDELREIGQALQEFPKRIGDRYEFRYGSDDPADRFYRLVVLGAYTVDSVGHCAIKVKLNQNQGEPDEGICEFSIRADVAAVNRLGALFTEFAELKHLEFQWNPDESAMYESHQPLIA
jgi:hypothetical protein